MTRLLRRAAVPALAVLLLSGCAAMSDPNSPWYLPPLTPQQQCSLGAGTWVLTYDNTGTASGGFCQQHH
jgi:hypothetical protein